MFPIIFGTLVGSFVSMGGGVLLLTQPRKMIERFSLYLTSFATGVMLATAFLDLFPEAQELASEADIFIPALGGVLLFFLLERYLFWFHHHEYDDKTHHHHPRLYLLVIGDIIHNFIDGVAIAASFLANPALGVTTTIAVALHEIPKEMANFSLLLTEGMGRKQTLLLNIATAFASLLGALLTAIIGLSVEPSIPMLLAFTGGMFVYIAAADLLPTLNERLKDKRAYKETSLLFIGILIVWVLRTLLEH